MLNMETNINVCVKHLNQYRCKPLSNTCANTLQNIKLKCIIKKHANELNLSVLLFSLLIKPYACINSSLAGLYIYIYVRFRTQISQLLFAF